MRAISKLLDKARVSCSLSTDAALAERIGISRQLLSNWRNGNAPVSQERVTEIARIAHEDAGAWLAAIAAEQSEGDVARAWLEAAKRLGFAAAVVVALLQPAISYAATDPLYIMRTLRRFLTFLNVVRRYRPAPSLLMVPS